jgi:hypothetical protein
MAGLTGRQLMLTLPVIGSLLVLCGLVYMAGVAIQRGRLSNAHSKKGGTPTLEPRHRTLAFLGPKANWPALLLIAIGAMLLIVPALLGEPSDVAAPAGSEGGEAAQ